MRRQECTVSDSQLHGTIQTHNFELPAWMPEASLPGQITASAEIWGRVQYGGGDPFLPIHLVPDSV